MFTEFGGAVPHRPAENLAYYSGRSSINYYMIELNMRFNEFDRLQRGSPGPMNPLDAIADIDTNGFNRWNGNAGWSPLQHEGLGMPQGLPMDQWNTAPPSLGSFITKRILRLDIPVNSFPNFNFVGRLLGPRGSSLKRVEASTGCAVSSLEGRDPLKTPKRV